MTGTTKLIKQRTRWLTAAKVYYLGYGEDSGMSDHEWDAIGRELFVRRAEIPWCPVLHDERYQGGSLFWVNAALYARALSAAQAQKSTDPQDTYVNGLAQANNEQD